MGFLTSNKTIVTNNFYVNDVNVFNILAKILNINERKNKNKKTKIKKQIKIKE